uniref:Uncharacterized protein n=1 Tax=Helicotheca tamesis TaxID=374047 RepID=A0A7S2MJW4_9STRA|mmetsp:Transcript_17251/g.23741  ORF Transcript_17251/g.23741 Transcript_17251/m.23741 type:complete len:107 (+) Transcript_17251:90-410(+)
MNTTIAALDEIHDVEVLGEWDHGLVGMSYVLDSAEAKAKETARIDPKLILKRTGLAIEAAIKNAVRNVGQDGNVREGVENHTEEEVCGMKLCVKTVVHQDSFVAPC